MTTTNLSTCGVSAATSSFGRSGPHLTVSVSGELDAASTPEVEAAILRHVHPDDGCLSIDLSAVTFCDSTGLKMLFMLHQRAEDEGSRFVIDRPSATVERLLDICDLSRVLAIRHGRQSGGSSPIGMLAGTAHETGSETVG